MIFVNLQLKINNGLESDFIKELNILLKETRSYEGCHSVYFIQNQDDPSNLEFCSKWDTKRHYEKYLQWRIDSGVMGEVAKKYLNGKPIWRYFDLVSEF